MKYLFKWLAVLIGIILWPLTVLWAWVLIYGDQAWCIVWHAGHDWTTTGFGKTRLFICRRCDRTRGKFERVVLP